MNRRPDVTDDERVDESGLDDRDRVFAESPVAPIGGMWFTLDESAPGGVRPLTEDELGAITAQVRATQAEAVADQIETADSYPEARPGAQASGDVLDAADEQEWQR